VEREPLNIKNYALHVIIHAGSPLIAYTITQDLEGARYLLSLVNKPLGYQTVEHLYEELIKEETLLPQTERIKRFVWVLTSSGDF